MGGSNRECCLHTKEGVKLGVIGDHSSWVWCAAVKPDSNFVVSELLSAVLTYSTYFLIVICRLMDLFVYI